MPAARPRPARPQAAGRGRWWLWDATLRAPAWPGSKPPQCRPTRNRCRCWRRQWPRPGRGFCENGGEPPAGNYGQSRGGGTLCGFVTVRGCVGVDTVPFQALWDGRLSLGLQGPGALGLAQSLVGEWSCLGDCHPTPGCPTKQGLSLTAASALTHVQGRPVCSPPPASVACCQPIHLQGKLPGSFLPPVPGEALASVSLPRKSSSPRRESKQLGRSWQLPSQPRRSRSRGPHSAPWRCRIRSSHQSKQGVCPLPRGQRTLQKTHVCSIRTRPPGTGLKEQGFAGGKKINRPAGFCLAF